MATTGTYLTTPFVYLGAQTPGSDQVCTYQFCSKGRHSMLFRVYSGLPLGLAFEQMWALCCGKKRRLWRKMENREDNGLLYHILQAIAPASSVGLASKFPWDKQVTLLCEKLPSGSLTPKLSCLLTSTHNSPQHLTSHPEPDGRWTLGYLPWLISLTLSWPIFPELTGPRVLYYTLPRMGYLQEWNSLGLRATVTGRWTWNMGSKLIWSAVISSGRPGGPQGYLPPRTKYFFYSILFVSGYRTACTSMSLFFFFLKMHIFLFLSF